MAIQYKSSDLHSDIREVVGLPKDEDKRKKVIANLRNKIRKANEAKGNVELSESGRNIHPERVSLHQREDRVYIVRSEDGRNALPQRKGGGRKPAADYAAEVDAIFG